MLWEDFQEVEYDIISDKICTYLYKTYKVTPVTVHDALYLTDDDLDKVTESIADIFWKLIDYRYLDYEIEETPSENEITDKEINDLIDSSHFETEEFKIKSEQIKNKNHEAKKILRQLKQKKKNNPNYNEIEELINLL